MAETRKFDLEERLIEFAVRVLNVVGALPQTREGKHVGGQLLRSGTSPAPNYGEAQSAESQKRFRSQNENRTQRIERIDGLAKDYLKI